MLHQVLCLSRSPLVLRSQHPRNRTVRIAFQYHRTFEDLWGYTLQPPSQRSSPARSRRHERTKQQKLAFYPHIPSSPSIQSVQDRVLLHFFAQSLDDLVRTTFQYLGRLLYTADVKFVCEHLDSPISATLTRSSSLHAWKVNIVSVICSVCLLCAEFNSMHSLSSSNHTIVGVSSPFRYIHLVTTPSAPH